MPRRKAALAVEIVVEAEAWQHAGDIATIIETALAVAASAVADRLPDSAEVAVALVDDDAIRAMNRTWRNKDSATNVLSFPAARQCGSAVQPAALGDIAIAYETTALEAGREGKSIENHVSHLAIHGFLHLLGHDHLREEEAEEMEALERAILASLGIPDPYAAS